MNSKREILIVPDKFKGSLTAAQVADCLESALMKRIVNIENTRIEKLPLADGGDGSLEVLSNAIGTEGHIAEVDTFDPLMRKIKAPMLLFEQDYRKCAFIEMAKCCGLTLLQTQEQNPEKTTTYGLGVMIKKAIELGAVRIIVGIGGSATNDGGAGMLENDISSDGVEFLVASDVDNPLLGPNGATMVYGPQKGADRDMLERLERRMEIFAGKAEKIMEEKGIDKERIARYRTIPGGGAAGGIGAAFYGFLNAELVPGWKLFGEMVFLEEKIKKADAVITGEGRFDYQSLSGKLIDGIASLCSKYKKELYVVCGQSLLPQNVWKKVGIRDVYTLSDIEPDIHRSINNAGEVMKGYYFQAGCDEAGRGALAGPVFAAAVVLPEGFYHPLLDDSKILSEHQREELRQIIEKEAVAWSVAAISPQEIDKINILNASIKGMHKALDGLDLKHGELSMIFVDGNKFKPYLNIVSHCVVKGDGKMSCIAAASILAKTHRDEYMKNISKEFPQYGWDKNVAYPTAEHREAIEKYGVTKYHRLSYKLLPDKDRLFF